MCEWKWLCRPIALKSWHIAWAGSCKPNVSTHKYLQLCFSARWTFSMLWLHWGVGGLSMPAQRWQAVSLCYRRGWNNTSDYTLTLISLTQQLAFCAGFKTALSIVTASLCFFWTAFTRPERMQPPSPLLWNTMQPSNAGWNTGTGFARLHHKKSWLPQTAPSRTTEPAALSKRVREERWSPRNPEGALVSAGS